MSFQDFGQQQDVVKLLQRCLERGRLAHAYLFSGSELSQLEGMAGTLAKALNCENPPRRASTGLALDCCDKCPTCRRIDNEAHPDVLWVRPESKSRIITIEQIRDLMQTIFLKPTAAAWKVAIIVAADRLNAQSANAFLKTLEEPPANSIIILLSTEPQRVLETLLSRCLRLSFSGGASQPTEPAFVSWLGRFSEMASAEQRSLLGRYQLLSVLLNRLNEIKATVNESLSSKSPLQRYDDLDPKTRDRLEDELAAAVEAEYRRQRVELLAGVQWWLRDVWLETLSKNGGENLISYPQFKSHTQAVAKRLTHQQAMENLAIVEEMQTLLASNVQEALSLEVGLLRLQL